MEISSSDAGEGTGHTGRRQRNEQGAEPGASGGGGTGAAKRCRMEWIIGETSPFLDLYQVDQPLGRPGRFASAFLVTSRVDGKQYAVKMLSKRKLQQASAYSLEILEAFRREVAVMRAVDHPHIVQFHTCLEDSHYLYIVMEACLGGELFDRIVSRQRYSEADAAGVLRQVLMGLDLMHKCVPAIAHCDLKPDNLLFADTAEDAPIKIIDFGSSKFVARRQFLYTMCTTPYYVAPEVLLGRYNQSADMWSVGVLTFVMLHGYPPFFADPRKYGAETNNVVFRLILGGFDPTVRKGFGSHFTEKIPISEAARDLITRLLESDPTKRLTAHEALEHPWITGEAASKDVLPVGVVRSIASFRKRNRFKERVLDLMLGDMADDQVAYLRDSFQRLDKNGDGVVTVDELKGALDELRRVEARTVAQLKDVQVRRQNSDGGDSVLSSVHTSIDNAPDHHRNGTSRSDDASQESKSGHAGHFRSEGFCSDECRDCSDRASPEDALLTSPKSPSDASTHTSYDASATTSGRSTNTHDWRDLDDNIRRILAEADLDGDGVLNYKEIMLTYVNRKLSLKEERLWTTFRRIDVNNDGVVSMDEFTRVFGSDVSEEQLAEILRQVDTDVDGKVSYDEFINLWASEMESAQQAPWLHLSLSRMALANGPEWPAGEGDVSGGGGGTASRSDAPGSPATSAADSLDSESPPAQW